MEGCQTQVMIGSLTDHDKKGGRVEGDTVL